MNKKRNLKFKLWNFLKFFPKMNKRKIKCLSIQKKDNKKERKVDLANNYKCFRLMSKLINKIGYMINLHLMKFLAIKEVFQRVKDS